jgi:cytochrome d ubiquinol oxidase subunit I
VGHRKGGTALNLFGIPDMKAETTRYAVKVPHLGSLILTHSWDGEIRGLKDFPPQDRPNRRSCSGASGSWSASASR